MYVVAYYFVMTHPNSTPVQPNMATTQRRRVTSILLVAGLVCTTGGVALIVKGATEGPESIWVQSDGDVWEDKPSSKELGIFKDTVAADVMRARKQTALQSPLVTRIPFSEHYSQFFGDIVFSYPEIDQPELCYGELPHPNGDVIVGTMPQSECRLVMDAVRHDINIS